MPTNHALRSLLLVSVCLCLLPWSASAATDLSCDAMARQNAQWQSELEDLSKAEQDFRIFFRGQLPNDTSTLSRVLAPIELELSIEESLAILRTQQAQLKTQIKALASGTNDAECDALVQLWKSKQRQRLKAQIGIIEAKLKLIQLPPASLTAMYRMFKAWQSVQQVIRDVESASASVADADAANLTTQISALTLWTQEYQSTLVQWLPLLLQTPMDIMQTNQAWLDSQSLKRVYRATQWPQLELQWPDSATDWKLSLEQAQSELLLSGSKWRNEAVWMAGWGHFFSAIGSPAAFADALLVEVLTSPKNLWDNLSSPFVREFKYRQRQNTLPGLVTHWFFQTAALVLVLLLAVKLAEGVPALVARLQQRSIQRLESTSSSRMASGIFWFIKPNAPWLVVLVITQLAATLATSQSILSWIGPAGLLYALFRITRVIFEWLLSRTYSRTGEFIPPSTAKEIEHDCHIFAWTIVFCGGVWLLGIGTGGGYLRYLIAIASLVIAWWALQWLLFRHREEVSKFIQKTSGKSSSPPRGWLAGLARFTTVPVQFLLRHFIDSLYGLNQKLLAFDSYRSFSVKLLRARLESKVDEDDGEDEAEPDESYTDWMMRPATETMVLEVGDPSRIIEPMQQWYKDKTEDNLVMLVGEAGSGKTTFVEQLPKLWKETEVRFIRFDTKINQPQAVLDAIAEALEQKQINDVSELVKIDQDLKQQVIVIDEAQNLFLAEVGQFDAYKTLLQCMNAQLDNIYWVVVMHAPSWSYLSCVFSREQRISNIFRMPRWSPQDIRRLILSRHQGAKRRLRYDELLLSAASNSESSSVRSADSRVFNILWEQSGGNPMAAIELWLNAAKVKGRIVEIGVPQRPSLTPLTSMNNDMYFVFAAIVVHRRLSTQEIMLATHFAEPIVRHALKQGFNLGLIERHKDGRYAVDSYWYGTLSSFLQRKNLLWM